MKVVGYKVMALEEDGKTIRAGANSRLNYDLDNLLNGEVLEMPGNGCYIGLNKEYVLDYYSGLADDEVFLQFEFDPKDITTGNINDLEPELSVTKLHLKKAEILKDGEIVEEYKPKQKSSRKKSLKI